MPKSPATFSPALFRFLKVLAANNNRDWFQANKSAYERDVLEPSLAFVEGFAPALKKVSPHFLAEPRRMGGSLMRIYRDTRFAKDKSPYKTNVGIQFRHEMGKNVHAPGFYVHLQPGSCYLGVGLWHPEPAALAKIRAAIDENRSQWKRARDDKRFGAEFRLAGDSLSKAPRDYPKDHPLIEDLKRKDFIAVKQLAEKDVLAPSFAAGLAKSFAAARPLMRFLCTAIVLPF